jgi:hypothetical protein
MEANAAGARTERIFKSQADKTIASESDACCIEGDKIGFWTGRHLTIYKNSYTNITRGNSYYGRLGIFYLERK